jgi:hypothetical protein
MKNVSNYRCMDRVLATSALIIYLGALGAPGPLGASSGRSTADLATAAKLDEEKALALVKAYAEKEKVKKVDFSRFESGRVRMERRKDGRIYWSVSYKRIVSKDEQLVLPGADLLLFTVDDETKEVLFIPGY